MNSQFKRGVLEMCILYLISTKDRYGYELVQEVSRKIDVTKGTVYPLLSRLKKENYFENYIKESNEGPARKYYQITAKGKEHVEKLINDYKAFNQKVNELLNTK